MGSIGWLAISDLHAGEGASTLWGAGEEELRKDLEKVHRHAGPFDFVLCAGDLAQAGTDEELAIAGARLTRIFEHLAALGSRPALFVVPGNHDLERPDLHAPAVRPLLHWSHDPELRGNLFWHPSEGHGYREVVSDTFAPFARWQQAWNEAHPLPAGWARNDMGMLPGDFVASVRSDGMSIGIAGLNSAFLQLTGAVHRGGMAIHPAQLQALTGDPHEWAMAHDACFLVTHHPPDWLTPDALPLYQGAIFRPEWFSAHFCGHMHEPQPVPSQKGGQANRVFQGPSLLGLESWIDAHGVRVPRVHGYSAARLDIDGERRATLRMWPRVSQAQKGGAGKVRFIPNHGEFELDDDGAFAVDLGVRLSVPPARSLRFPGQRGAGVTPLPRSVSERPPGTTHRQPGAAQGHPGAASGEPGTAQRRVGTTLGEPGTAQTQPGTARPAQGQPETAHAPRPGHETGHPGQGTARPGQETPRPGHETGHSGQETGHPGQGTARPGQDAPRPESRDEDSIDRPVRPRAARASVEEEELDLEELDDALEPPGLGYNPRWYVPNEPKEQLILGTLRHPGAPVVVTAPPFSGKSTVLQRIVARLRDEHRKGHDRCLVVLIDLGSLGDAALNDPAVFFLELGHMIVDGYRRALREAGRHAPDDADRWIARAWQRPGAPETRLTSMLERTILRDEDERMVLAIDRADRFVGRPAGDPMARMLRQWVRAGALGDPSWGPFRLALAVAGSALYFYAPDAVSELFASATHVRIESFDLPDVRALAKLYGGGWSADELARLTDLVDGQPYLCRLVLFLSRTGVAKAELLDVERLKIEHCATVLRQVWLRVAEQPDLRKPMCLLLRDPTTKLTTDEYHRLYQAGLVRRVDGAYSVPNKLIASYFREQC